MNKLEQIHILINQGKTKNEIIKLGFNEKIVSAQIDAVELHKKTKLPTPEGKTFEFLDESHINTDFIETFDFTSEQLIITETKEFSAVCPFSGLPDIAYIKIEYRPIGGRCVELKSLKYYFTSFRNVGIYQEAATKRIYLDLKQKLNTDNLRVTSIYNTRGGFDTTCIEGNL